MRRNWRLLSSVAAGTLVAAAVLSATAIYADAIRDLGLSHSLQQQDERQLDLRIFQSNIPVTAANYQSGRQRQDGAVSRATQGTVGGVTRQASTATFYPTAPGAQVDEGDPTRLRGNVIFRSDFEDHIQLLQGVFPAPQPEATNGPVDVMIGPRTAEQIGISLGDEFDLHPFWQATTGPVRVRVVGIGTELDAQSRYWGVVDERIDARDRTWQTLRMWVSETTFFGALRQAMPTVTADYLNIYEVRLDALNARNAVPIADGLRSLAPTLASTEERPSFNSTLETTLRTFDQKLFFTRIPLLVLLLQIGAIVAYYLVMVSTMLIERQGAEIATMRSRGATTFQLLGIYGVEGTILAALAAAIGPPLAAAVISLLGPTPAFSALSGGGALTVHIGSGAYILAGLGAFIAFASLMIPAWRATRNSVVEFKRGAARPSKTPLFLRYYLDVVVVLIVAALFWRLSQQDELFTEGLFGETTVDPVLLATPAVFMVTVGVVFLRLFPIALRGIAWAVGWTRSVAILIGMRSLVRQPSHYTRLILLLMFATGVGMFGATFSATLGQSYVDRAAYEAGADVRAQVSTQVITGGDESVRALAGSIPAQTYSPATRLNGSIQMPNNRGNNVQVLGIEPQTFAELAYLRDDFATDSATTILDTLASSAMAPVSGVLLPEGATELGMWLRFPDVRGRVSIGITLRDSAGGISNRVIGSVVPTNPEARVEDWRFYTVSMTSGLSRGGGRTTEQALEGPVEIIGAFIAPSGRIAQQRGVVVMGPAYARTAISDDPVFADVQDQPWADGIPVADFSDGQYQVAQGLASTPSVDVARPVSEGPPGEAQALRYEWQDSGLSPGVRGLSLAVEHMVAPVYVSRQTAQQLELSVGSRINLIVTSRYVAAEVAGIVDYFPTFIPGGRDGLVVMDVSRLLGTLNAAIPDRTTTFTELWFATDDPDATIAALDEAGLRQVVGREALQLQQQEDPLIAAGWQGILAISFGAVLLLSAIGFIVYSYLTAQQRGLEFAILRTLGFSKPQIFSVVVFEHLFVILAGMGLGTLVGLRIGQIMMGFLATDETGAAVVPPFILGVSWTQVFIVWAILGSVFIATIAAVVAMYFRLAVSRVLRIGDA